MRKTRLLLLAEALLESAERHIQAIRVIRGSRSNPVVIAGRALAHFYMTLSCCHLAGGIALLAIVFRLRAVK